MTDELLEKTLDVPVIELQSAPLGGDRWIGAKIAEVRIDFMILFWDPLEPHPHDPDVKARPAPCGRRSRSGRGSAPAP